jgi:predicted DNA-binding transcriptional regulator YafY
MANTSSRTLRLLSLLQTRRYWPGGELAGRLGVSARTLRRDIDRLRELGYPVEAQRGTDGGYQLAAGAALPPLMVDDDEAVALAVGLQTAAQGAAEGIAEASVRALAKVVQVMPGRLRRRVEALTAMTVPASWDRASWDRASSERASSERASSERASSDMGTRPSLDPGALTTIALACRDAERLRFTYVAAGGTRSARHVEPHRLVSLGRRWYLVGYDLGRQDWRSFRLDRLTEPRGTGARFRPRELPAEDAAAFVRAGIGTLWSVYDVEVVAQAPAEQVRTRIGRWASVEAEGPDRCRIRMSADGLEWPLMGLGITGAEFTVVSPPELVEQLRDWGGRFTRAAAG